MIENLKLKFFLKKILDVFEFFFAWVEINLIFFLNLEYTERIWRFLV